MLHIIACAGASGKDDSLVLLHKRQSGQLQDPVLVHSLLEGKVEVRQQFPFGQLALPDSAFDPAFHHRLGLQGEEPLQGFQKIKLLVGRFRQLLFEALQESMEFQGFQMPPDCLQAFLHPRLLPV